LVLLQ